ncbi:hypothetical protein WL08_20710 [Burkholderia ubonensis]|nr:hypothetical protein WL08_20710 [Burkholderia ubonensis]
MVSRYRTSQRWRDGSLAGLALLDHAAKVIDQVNRMAHEMSDYVAGVRGHRVSAAAAGTGTSKWQACARLAEQALTERRDSDPDEYRKIIRR